MVQPTDVTYGLAAGVPKPNGLSTSPGRKASLSPDETKNDWPCSAICCKIWSVVAEGPPIHPQEQLTCRARLSVAMRFSTSFGWKLDGLPSYTRIWFNCGAMEITISMSRETSISPPLPVG